MEDEFSDYDPVTGVCRHVVRYCDAANATGTGDEIFSIRCPSCGRFVKAHERAEHRGGITIATGDCSKCGSVRLNFVCWVHDSYE